MKREEIKALLNLIRKKLGTERGYKELGFAFYFDAMTACEMLGKILDKGCCFTSSLYDIDWFKANGFSVRALKIGHTIRYVIS